MKTPEQLARLLWILLLCSGANAVVGVLQVYDPGPLAAGGVLAHRDRERRRRMGAVTYIGAHGQRIVRPPGLFDTPGAVAGPAMFAALLGLVFAVSAIPVWKRALSLGVAGAGLAAIYLSQVRVSLVATVVMMARLRRRRVAPGTRGARHAVRDPGRRHRRGRSVARGRARRRRDHRARHDAVRRRSDHRLPGRARHAADAARSCDLLFQYPLGAGLGRWGMAAGYFGSANPNSAAIWAEIQFTGWMIDGGVLMIALYMGAIVTATIAQWRVAIATAVPAAGGLRRGHPRRQSRAGDHDHQLHAVCRADRDPVLVSRRARCTASRAATA